MREIPSPLTREEAQATAIAVVEDSSSDRSHKGRPGDYFLTVYRPREGERNIDLESGEVRLGCDRAFEFSLRAPTTPKVGMTRWIGFGALLPFTLALDVPTLPLQALGVGICYLVLWIKWIMK